MGADVLLTCIDLQQLVHGSCVAPLCCSYERCQSIPTLHVDDVGCQGAEMQELSHSSCMTIFSCSVQWSAPFFVTTAQSCCRAPTAAAAGSHLIAGQAMPGSMVVIIFWGTNLQAWAANLCISMGSEPEAGDLQGAKVSGQEQAKKPPCGQGTQ